MTVYVDADAYHDVVEAGCIAGDTVTARYGTVLTIRESTTVELFQITTTDSVIKITTAQRKLVLVNDGTYVNCVPGDIGLPVVGAVTTDSGTLVDYDNATRVWHVLRDDPTDDQFDNAAEGISITGGTGAGTMNGAAAQFVIVKFNATANSGIVVSGSARLITRGDWFTLGVGDNSPGQAFATFYGAEACPFVRVETGSATNVWTSCRCIYNTLFTAYGAGVMGDVFQHAPDAGAPIASITFGDGTNGMKPPNLARVQCPDIYITSAAAYTATVANRSRIYYATLSGTSWDFENVIFSDRFALTAYIINSIHLTNVGVFGRMNITQAAHFDFDTFIVSKDRAVTDILGLYVVYGSGEVANLNAETYGSTGTNAYAAGFTFVFGLSIADSKFVATTKSGTASYSQQFTLYLSGCKDLFVDEITLLGGSCYFNTIGLPNGVDGVRYSDSPCGAKSVANATPIFYIQNCDDFYINDVTLVAGGSAPYDLIIRTNGTMKGGVITNIAFDLDTRPSYLIYCPQSDGLKIANCDFTGAMRTGHINMTSVPTRTSVKNITFGTAATNVILVSKARVEGMVVGAALSFTNLIGMTDTPYFLIYDSAAKASGYICLVMVPQKDLSYYAVIAGDTDKSIYFDNTGNLYMKSIGDSCTFEIPYLIQGVTAFKNVASTIAHATWEANCTKEYAIKDGVYGSVWGAWTQFDAAHLILESVDPDIGFYMKFRFTMTGAHATNNKIQRFMIPVDTEPTFMFPVGYVDLELRNLVIGSNYWVWDVTNARWLGQGTAAATSVTIEVPYDFDGTDVAFQVHVRKGSAATFYKPWHGTGTYNEDGAIVFCAQEADTIVTADLTAPISFDIPTKLIIVADTVSTVTVQSLVNAIRDFETDNPDQETFAEISGKDAVVAGLTYTGIMLRLTGDWRVQFESRVGPGWTNCTVTGGDLTASNTFADDPFAPAAFVNMTRGMSTASSLLETGLDVTLEKIEKKVDDNQALILTR